MTTKTKLPRLDPVANPEQYRKLYHKSAMLGRWRVVVTRIKREGRVGSYERGVGFRETVYGVLSRSVRPSAEHGYATVLYSVDHGATWHRSMMGINLARVKGKVVLSKRLEKEFAFEDIQRINRKYDPGFRWYP